MSTRITLPYRVYHRALETFRDRPGAALVGPAGVREGEDGVEYLVPDLSPELPLFLRQQPHLPAVRVVEYPFRDLETPHAPRWWQERRSGPLVEIALGARARFAGIVTSSGETRKVTELRLPGRRMLRAGRPRRHAGRFVARRFSRETGAFGGMSNFERFLATSFCVVGAGRSGSLATHDIARRSPRQLVLIDPDVIEDHNITAMEISAGIRTGTPKVEAVRSFLESVEAPVRPEVYASSVLVGDAFKAAAGTDIVISTVDHNAARLHAAIVATLFLKPHLDIGTGLLTEHRRMRVGFDVRLVLPGDGCLLCVGGLPDVTRPRPRDFREERVGSTRSLNEAAVGHGMRLLERLYAGSISQSVWQRYEEGPSGADRLIAMEHIRDPGCPLCRLQGLGDLAGTVLDSLTTLFSRGPSLAEHIIATAADDRDDLPVDYLEQILATREEGR